MELLYKHSATTHNTRAAEVIVPMLLDFFSGCKSVLDVGCGTGTWLKVFRDHEITDVLGIDGEFLDKGKLVIPLENFKESDLRLPFAFPRRFDLLLCIEVAEHLPPSSANEFVQCLCRHSDTIVFSAAIPGQGGQNHMNEQWPRYWEAKFNEQGFSRLDIIRPRIWNDDRVDVWYRQNLFVYTTDKYLIEKHPSQYVSAEIHPELWEKKIASLQKLAEEVNNFDLGGAGIIRSVKALLNAIKNKL